MDTPDLLKAIARRVAQVPGVAGASYPELNAVPASPWVMVIDGNQDGASVVEREFDGQTVRARITIRVLVVSQKDRPREATKIDTLVTPILDALDPAALGVAPNELLPGLPATLDRIWDTASVVRGSVEQYAGQFCYAADIGIEAQFRREPQEIPL